MAEQQRQSLCPRLIDYLAIVGSRSANIKNPGNGQNPPVQVSLFISSGDFIWIVWETFFSNRLKTFSLKKQVFFHQGKNGIDCIMWNFFSWNMISINKSLFPEFDAILIWTVSYFVCSYALKRTKCKQVNVPIAKRESYE